MPERSIEVQGNRFPFGWVYEQIKKVRAQIAGESDERKKGALYRQLGRLWSLLTSNLRRVRGTKH